MIEFFLKKNGVFLIRRRLAKGKWKTNVVIQDVERKRKQNRKKRKEGIDILISKVSVPAFWACL